MTTTKAPAGTVPVLKRALEIIIDPEHWTQGCDARRPSLDGRGGIAVLAYHPEADRWCVDGAFQKATLELVGHPNNSPRGGLVYTAARGRFAEVNSLGGVASYNDSVTHSEVVATLKRAIWARR